MSFKPSKHSSSKVVTSAFDFAAIVFVSVSAHAILAQKRKCLRGYFLLVCKIGLPGGAKGQPLCARAQTVARCAIMKVRKGRVLMFDKFLPNFGTT